MKKFLLFICLLTFATKAFSQQFSQYNTGTLYDSFENPSQRAFIPDSSKQFVSNFLIPNFNANFYLTGDAQSTLKNRLFLGTYDNTALQIGQHRYNHYNLNANVYVAMFKMFASIRGDEELGFSVQTKAEGRGIFTDESIALFNGTQSFNTANVYSNIFNNNGYFQSYNQFSLTYRERFSKDFSFGIKLSGLFGVQYDKIDIKNSAIAFNSNDEAFLALQGSYRSGFIPGHLDGRDYLPSFRSPGAAVSIGTTYRTEDGFIIQANIKDLGFIHWNSLSIANNFDSNADIQGLSTIKREDSLYNAFHKIIVANKVTGSFNTPINGKAEISVNRSFWIDDDKMFKYSPTLVASKDLYYTGFVGALVNPIQYKNYILTITATYDDLKLFNVGTQFMYKSPNIEVFIGSDRLLPTTSFAIDGLSKSASTQNGSFTGADIFLGFSFKFGPLIEHPMNASSIPGGEKGFLARLYGRLFKTNN